MIIAMRKMYPKAKIYANSL